MFYGPQEKGSPEKETKIQEPNCGSKMRLKNASDRKQMSEREKAAEEEQENLSSTLIMKV